MSTVPAKLTDEERKELLPALSKWEMVEGRDAITRTFIFDDFESAWSFMSNSATYAQAVSNFRHARCAEGERCTLVLGRAADQPPPRVVQRVQQGGGDAVHPRLCRAVEECAWPCRTTPSWLARRT